MFNTSVITSRAAQNNFDKLKSEHSLLLQGIADQAVRVNAYNQQRQAEMASQQAVQGEMQKEERAADTEVMKSNLDFATKQAELDIKRAALAQTD